MLRLERFTRPVVVLLFSAAWATAAWFLVHTRQQAQLALASLERKKQERDGLARQSPALSAENEQAIERDLASLHEVLAAWQAAMHAGDLTGPAAPPPGKPIELYFDLAAFVEKTRQLAARAQVGLRPDEHFGFSAYATAGPPADLLPAVYRQRVLGQEVIVALLESHPRALLAVQRERPLAAVQRAGRPPMVPADGRAPATAGDRQQDYFDLDERLSLRLSGRWESEAFRYVFTGQTPVLRAFLNRLAAFGPLAIVRSVEAEPVQADPAPPDPADRLTAAGSPAPLVSRNLTQFSVVVECLQPVVSAEAPLP
jgi:hypothetical protein